MECRIEFKLNSSRQDSPKMCIVIRCCRMCSALQCHGLLCLVHLRGKRSETKQSPGEIRPLKTVIHTHQAVKGALDHDGEMKGCRVISVDKRLVGTVND